MDLVLWRVLYLCDFVFACVCVCFLFYVCICSCMCYIFVCFSIFRATAGGLGFVASLLALITFLFHSHRHSLQNYFF